MGIRVRHDPPVAGAGALAVQVGLGARSDKNREFGQRDRQLDLQAASIRAQSSASHSRIAAQERMQQSAQQHQNQQAEIAQSQYMDRMAFQDELTKGRVQFEYTEQQKREMEKYAQGLAWIQEQGATGAWSPAQVEDAYNQLNAKMIGIQPVPKYDDTPTGRDQFDAQAFYHDEIGEWIIPDRSGGFKVLESKKEAKAQLDPMTFTKMYQAYEKALTVEEMDDDGNKKTVLPDPDVVMGSVMRALNAFDQYNQMASGHHNPQQGNPQAGPQPEPVPQGPGQQLTQTGTNSWEIHDADKKPLGINADHKEQARVWGEHYKLSDDETALIAMRLAEGVNPRDILKVLMKNAK